VLELLLREGYFGANHAQTAAGLRDLALLQRLAGQEADAKATQARLDARRVDADAKPAEVQAHLEKVLSLDLRWELQAA